MLKVLPIFEQRIDKRFNRINTREKTKCWRFFKGRQIASMITSHACAGDTLEIDYDIIGILESIESFHC